MAIKHFFITGLPRSRTAWMSAYLSFSDVACLHDGFRGLTHPMQIKEKLQATCAHFAGSADPSILMFQDQIFKSFPKAKYVYIFRDARDCDASWKKIGGNNMKGQALRAVEFLKQRSDILIVPFEELDERADDVGRFVTDGTWDCPAWRHDLMNAMRVEQHLDKASATSDMHTVKELLSYAKI